MPLILIKNNLKLMLRSKWVLVIMIVLPLITIALLANAFHDMLETVQEIDEFEVGYRISEDSIHKDMLPELKDICKDNSIVLLEYPQGDITKLLQSETVAVFVDIEKDSYRIYQSNDKMTESAITKSILSGFFYQINETLTALSYGTELAVGETPSQRDTYVTREVLNTEPIPNSTDYYGIIYIVYFAWCGMISLVAVISSERRSAIPTRMRVSHMPKINHYLGKLIPCSLAIFIEVCTAWILSVVLYDIHWGNIGLSFLAIVLISIGASAFGILLFQLFNNVAISIVLGFIINWITGFFGGSFQTYMYANLPMNLVRLSPLYHINRMLVEFSTKGYSDYTDTGMGFLVGIIVVCTIGGVLLMNRRMEEH